MSPSKPLRVRRSILVMQKEYEQGKRENKPGLMKPLEDLVRAWRGIQARKPEDTTSYFNLAGFHGEPFSGAGYGDGTYWGGYCNHGNILFPTWHRFYVLKVENALRSVEGCENVTLPYWDETDEYSLANGIPSILTDKTFELDGETINNPLYSFTLPGMLNDSVQADNGLYNKPAGYTTVRYPLSGLVGTADAIAKTAAHNARYPYPECVHELNTNIKTWLKQETIYIPPGDGGKPSAIVPADIHQKFINCLKAPNYTVFSNTTSAGKYNNTTGNTETAVSLESPHNSIHLAVGGCDLPVYDRSPIPGANGDMGENNTASFDPIFFFHHCNIDRVFWLWQKQHNATDKLEIIDKYPGTNSSDSQGATPGTPPNSWLTTESPLDPFKHSNGKPCTSLDCINIETQLNYTYEKGSLENFAAETLTIAQGATKRKLAITNINRAGIRGSFVISAFVKVNEKKYYLGSEAILSRWNVTGCRNCQTHLEAKAFFDLEPIHEETLTKAMLRTHNMEFSVEVHGKEDGDNINRAFFESFSAENVADRPYHLEII